MTLSAKIESILFVGGKSFSTKKLAEILGVSPQEINNAIHALEELYRAREAGITILETHQGWQMGSAPQAADLVERLTKEEVSGELTKPQLETLAIISYRGPITKGELEEIRGVNCSLILRNLLMRGLISEELNTETRLTRYGITHEFLRFLGLSSAQELPNFETLNNHAAVRALLERSSEHPESV